MKTSILIFSSILFPVFLIAADSKPESMNSITNQAIILAILAIGAVGGFLSKAIWDYFKLKISYKSEIKKLSIRFYYDYAKNYYFKILYTVDDLKDSIIKYKEPNVEEAKIQEIGMEAFYYFTFYIKARLHFFDASGVWFLCKLEHENKIVEYEKQIKKILALELEQTQYLESFLRQFDKSYLISDLKTKMENDNKLTMIFNNFISCLINNHKELLDITKGFSDVLMKDLNSAFKYWYKQ